MCAAIRSVCGVLGFKCHCVCDEWGVHLAICKWVCGKSGCTCGGDEACEAIRGVRGVWALPMLRVARVQRVGSVELQ